MENYVEEEFSDTACRRYDESIECFYEQCINDYNLIRLHELPIRTLSVENISKQTSSRDLEQFFSRYGAIEECTMELKRGKPETFVTFSSAEDAFRASTDGRKNRLVLHNRILQIEEVCFDYEPGYAENRAGVGQVCPNTESARNDNDDTKMDILNDDCLIQIFLHLPILDRIRLERVCKRWQAASKASWSHVRKLALSKSTWGFSYQSTFTCIGRNMLRNVLGRCGRHLKEIHFSSIFDETYSEPLSDVAEFCPNVQVINASMISVSSNSIVLLSRNCHNIRCLNLCEVDEPCDSALAKLFDRSTDLTQFIGCLDLRGECLLHLPRKTIRKMMLTDCNSLDFYCLARALSTFKNLSVLGLCKNDLTPDVALPVEVVEALTRHCKQLKRLEVTELKLVGQSCKIVTSELNNLEVLVLQETDISDPFLVQLSNFHKLTHLNISGCSSITWAGISALASLPKLGTLKINQWSDDVSLLVKWRKNRGLQIGGLPRTSDFPSLKHLECATCYILSPNEMCCLIESSPVLELVDFSGYDYRTRGVLENLITYVLTRNNKVAFKVSY